MEKTIVIILSSTVLATILSGIINYLVSQRLRQLDYKNEYFKKILQKRLEVYELIDYQMNILKTSVLDNEDGRAYHRVFSLGQGFFLSSFEPLMNIVSKSVWVNTKTLEKIMELSALITQISFSYHTVNEESLITAGKEHYRDVCDIRDEIEKLMMKDFLTLYDLKHIKEKKSINGFQKIHIPKERI
jgi:hypothetical protein